MDILYVENIYMFQWWMGLIAAFAILVFIMLFFALLSLEHIKSIVSLMVVIILGTVFLFVFQTRKVPVYCVQLNEETSFLEIYENYEVYEVINEEDHIYKLIDIKYKDWERWK